MKKFFIILTVIAGLLIAALIALATIDFNRLGKDNLYVQIQGDGSVEKETVSGVVYETYWYTLPAVDEDGNVHEVTFSAQKNLRHKAYLMLYTNDEGEVTSYDEVSLDDIPKKAQQQL